MFDFILLMVLLVKPNKSYYDYDWDYYYVSIIRSLFLNLTKLLFNCD